MCINNTCGIYLYFYAFSIVAWKWYRDFFLFGIVHIDIDAQICNIFITSCTILSTVGYEEILCNFYCQLEFWAVQASEHGVPLPPITARETHLSLEEQWNNAIEERDKLADIWKKESARRGLVVDFSTSFGDSGLENGTLSTDL